MKWAIVNSDNIIENIIAYDGQSEFDIGDELRIVQVDDAFHIGHNINDPVDNSAAIQDLKANKIADLKSYRNSKNSEPIITTAYEITVDENGNNVIGSNIVSFQFKTASIAQPASEPNSIILGVLISAITDPDVYIRYSCTIINEDETTRKGYIKLDQSVANQIKNLAASRVQDYILQTNSIETLINNADTIQEIYSININF